MFDNGKKQDQHTDGALQDGCELALEQAKQATRDIVAQLGCPCRIFSEKASYEDVMDAYEEAVLQGQQEGFTPVLIPSDDILAEYLGFVKKDGYSLEEVLKADLKSGEELLNNQLMEDFGEEGPGMEEFMGDFEEEPEAVDRYMAFLDYRSGGIMETILLKAPTTRPWELVAYVPFGGWNECPGVEEMMAICKYWYEKYCAVPVTISHDVMEMRVPAPIPEEDSMQVAKEHFAFTEDRVTQCTGTGTLNELAACIAVSPIWYFWWD